MFFCVLGRGPNQRGDRPWLTPQLPDDRDVPKDGRGAIVWKQRLGAIETLTAPSEFSNKPVSGR
jgi:hypothetical protein